MANRKHNVANGRVAVTATEIAGSLADEPQRVLVVFSNIGLYEETVVLSLSVNGGTARQLFQFLVKQDESQVIDGLPLDSNDSLKALTDHADSVDYVVSIAPPNTPFRVYGLSVNGATK